MSVDEEEKVAWTAYFGAMLIFWILLFVSYMADYADHMDNCTVYNEDYVCRDMWRQRR